MVEEPAPRDPCGVDNWNDSSNLPNDNLKVTFTLTVTEALAFSFIFFGILNLTYTFPDSTL